MMLKIGIKVTKVFSSLITISCLFFFLLFSDKRLLNILLHEIGHVFGLDHSSNPRSIMSPLFRLDTAEIQSEDVRNLRLLLGLDKR